MATVYTREHLKICIAKICLTIGWHNAMSTPLEMLTDILYTYLYYLAKVTADYAHQFGMTEANLEHLSLTFKDFRLNLKDFNDYINSVECPSKIMVPKYPVHKQDSLNFLKPGSKEVISRQIHIHEHLPPMFPLLESNDTEVETSVENMEVESKSTLSLQDIESKKRPRIIVGHSVRELTSIMMTTSGFLSPICEGKLPESRAPAIPLESPVSPNESFKKPKIKKILKKRREFFKQFSDHESLKKVMKIRKRKIKYRNIMAAKNYMIVSNTNKPPQQENVSLQNESIMTNNIPLPQPPIYCSVTKEEPYVEKLSTKPSKRKINILRKISVKYKPFKISKVEEPSVNIAESLPTATSNVPGIFSTFPSDLTIKPISPIQVMDNNNKKKVDILRLPLMKTKKGNDLHKAETKSTYCQDNYDGSTGNNSFKYQASNDLNIEPVNLVLPTNIVNKRKADIIKKISIKNKLSNIPSNRENKNYATDFTASVMKDVGLHHNICKDLIIEPITPMTATEKSVKLESYSNIPQIDTSITPRIVTNSQSSPRIRSEPKVVASKPHGTIAFDVNHQKMSSSISNITQPPINSVHFPFFNPFAGPGLIPPPLMNPLFPHLPISPLGLPAFGQLPMSVPSVPPKTQDPVNLTISSEIPVLQSHSLSVPPQVEVINDNASQEHGNILLNLKLKKKKKKKDKSREKSEKRRKEKLDYKKLKRESKHMNSSSEPSPPLKFESLHKYAVPLALATHNNETSLLEQSFYKRDVSPELAKFSALVTGQPKQKNYSLPSKQIEITSTSAKRGRGRPRIHPVTLPKKEIWTCPICGSEDNGNPMICCDDCNTWYHWVCVGIQIPPEASEDWYCRQCINTKMERLESSINHRAKEKRW